MALFLSMMSLVLGQSDKDRNSKLLQLRKIATSGNFVIELDHLTYK